MQATILSIKFELLPNSLYFLFLFSLQRLHLLLIIIFKAKRLNNKIIFQKEFTTYFYFRFCDSRGKQKWWSQEWTNSSSFEKFCFPLEGFLMTFLLVCVWFLYIEDDINWRKVHYWVCDSSVPSQVLVHFSSFWVCMIWRLNQRFSSDGFTHLIEVVSP